MAAKTSQVVVDDAITASLAAQGLSQKEIAARTGLSQPTIHRKLKKAEVKALVEKTATELAYESARLIKDAHIKALRKANQLYQRALDDPGETEIDEKTGRKYRVESLSDSDKLLLTLADKKEYRIGQMMGIFPSHAPSVVIQNIFQAGVQNVILPNVAAALGAAGCAQFELPGDDAGQSDDDSDEDVIDVGE